MSHSQPIVIRIKKGADGRSALSCTRADGTTTWQSLKGGQAAFFPRHDLTHYAVETVLGHRKGFYGLVAAGWDLSDFGTPWPRGKLPPDANLSEVIVGFFDRERATGQLGTAEELNESIASFCAEYGVPARDTCTEDELDRVRQKRAELFAQWDYVKPGDALELPFDLESADASATASVSRKRPASAKSR
jgi:hypothetical protein